MSSCIHVRDNSTQGTLAGGSIPYLPVQGGSCVHTRHTGTAYAILYVDRAMAARGEALPSRFGNWHTVYMRMNRWRPSSGVLDSSVRTAAAKGQL